MQRRSGRWGPLTATLVALLAFAAPAAADEIWSPSEQDLSGMGGSGPALVALRAELDGGPINLCAFAPGLTQRARLSAVATGHAVTVRCAGLETPLVYTFRNAGTFVLPARGRRERLMLCRPSDGGVFYGRQHPEGSVSCLQSAGQFGFYERERLRRFVTAWTVLSKAAAWQAPDDAALRAYLQAAPAIGPETQEALRRTQVQVEVAIREQRPLDASRLYYDALAQAPNWADGQFNRALLLGELEFFGGAIYHMRSYLILSPGAPDARAAQDKIYEWEARLTAAAR